MQPCICDSFGYFEPVESASKGVICSVRFVPVPMHAIEFRTRCNCFNFGLGYPVYDDDAVVKSSANHSTRYGQSGIRGDAFQDVTKTMTIGMW